MNDLDFIDNLDFIGLLMKTNYSIKSRYFTVFNYQTNFLYFFLPFPGLRQRRIERAQGLSLLHGCPAPTGGRWAAAASGVAQRLKTQAAQSVHQTGAGAEGAECASVSQAHDAHVNQRAP